MTHSALRYSALVAFVGCAVARAPAASSQATPVTGVRVSVIKQERHAFQVTIENRRDSVLIDVEVAARFVRLHQHVAVGPHERQLIWADMQDGAMPESPRIIYAAFADGTAEGERRPVQDRLKDRQEHLDDLGFWVRSFMNTPHVSSVALRRFLVDRIAERSAVEGRNGPRVSDRVRELLRAYANGPDIWAPLDDLRTRVEAELKAAISMPFKTPSVVDGVTSATVVSSDVVPADAGYVAVIENLREVPIEAIAIEEIDAASGRPRAGRRMDFCLSDAAIGRGRIQPHERREIAPAISSRGADHEVRVSFVLFDDQSFEGSTAVRDEVFRRREETADEDVFAIDTLKAVETKAQGEIERLLLDAKVERSRQVQLAGRESRPYSPLDEALRMFRESPSTFAGRVPAYRASLEKAVRQLRRHLAAPAK